MTMLENTRKWRKTKRGLVTNLYQKMKELKINPKDYQKQ